MKKGFHFTEMSDRICIEPGCEKRLKARLVAKKRPDNIIRCYMHHLLHLRKTKARWSRELDGRYQRPGQ